MDGVREQQKSPGNATGKKVVGKEVMIELRRRQMRRRRIFFTSIGVALLLIVVLVCYKLHVYSRILDLFGVRRDVSVDPVLTQIAYTPKGTYVLGAADGCIIVCDENGVTGLDRNGAWKWNLACSVTTPVMNCYGSFLLLTDQGGKSVWALNGSGQMWRYNTEKPVLGAFACADGSAVTVLCQEDDFVTSAIGLRYEKGAIQEHFTRKFGSYHMIAGAYASGKGQMALSGVYAAGGNLTGAVEFLRLSDGEVFSTELEDGQTYLELQYLDGDVLFAANSDSLRRMRKAAAASDREDFNEPVWSRDGGRTRIAGTVALHGRYCVAAFCPANMEESDSAVSKVICYDTAGRQVWNMQIDGSVRGIASYGNTVSFYTERTVRMVHENGATVGEYTLDSDVADIAYIDARNLLVVCGESVARISFEDKNG